VSQAPERAGSVAGVELWRVSLAVGEPELAGMLRCLTPGEQRRAEGLARPEVRRRFVASRCGLRLVLAAWREGAVPQQDLALGPFGKPSLPGGPRFSVSHAEEQALIAVDPRRELGVDLEPLRPVPESEAIARLCFAADEVAELSAAQAEGPDSFLRLWTRREAYLKALGVGFSGEESRIPFDRERWAAHPLELPPGLVGTLVVERIAPGAPA